MGIYTVKQGDTVPSIARAHGFHDWRIIYNHKDNADLKSRRPNPNILFPGDKVTIPPMKTKSEPGATGRRHTFRLSGDTQWLRVVLKHVDDSPMAGVAYKLRVNEEVIEGKTSATGLLEHKIPALAHDAKLETYRDDGSLDRELTLKVGFLDPGDTPTGWKGPLNNLGYKAGKLDTAATKQASSAVEEFQCDKDLVPPTGNVGWKTQDTIEKAHGV